MFPFTPQYLPYRRQYAAPPRREFSYPYGSLPVTPSNVFGSERRVVSIHHPSSGFMTPESNMNYQQTNGGGLAANFQPYFQGMNVEPLPIYSQNRKFQFVQPTPIWYPPQPLENAAGNLGGASESTLDPNAQEFIPSGLLRQRVSFKNAGMNLVNMASEEDLVVIEKAIEQGKKESLQLDCKLKKHGNKSYSYGEWATGRLKGQGSDYELVEFDDNFILVKARGKNAFRTNSEYCDSAPYKEAVSLSFQWSLADGEIKFDFTQALNEEKLRLFFDDLYGGDLFVPAEYVARENDRFFATIMLAASFLCSESDLKDKDVTVSLVKLIFREGFIPPWYYLFSKGWYFSPNGFVFKLFQLKVNTLRLPVGISEAAAAFKSLQETLPVDDSVFKEVVMSNASDLIGLVRDSFIFFRTTIESNVIAGVNISGLAVINKNPGEYIVSMLFVQGHLFLRFCAFCYSESIQKAEEHYIKSLLGFSTTINICIAQRNQSINEASIFFLGSAWLSVVYETEEKKLFHKAVISELESKQKTEAFSSCLAKTACNILSRAISSENYCDVAKLTLFVMSKSILLETVNEAIATSWLEACTSICDLLREALGASGMFSDVSGNKVFLWIKFEEMERNIWKYFVRPMEAICKKIESNHKELVASHNLSNVDATMREMFCEAKARHDCLKSIDELANFISPDAQGKRAHKETFFHPLVHAKKKAIEKEYPAISSGDEIAAGFEEKSFSDRDQLEQKLEKLFMDKKEALSVRLCAVEKTQSSIQRIVNGEFAQPEFGEFLFWVYGEVGHYLHVKPAVSAFYGYKVLVNKLNNHCLELIKKFEQEEVVHNPLEWFDANSWSGKPLKVTELHKLCFIVHNKPIIAEAKACLQTAVLCFEHGLDLAIIQVEGVAGKRSDEKQHSVERSHLEFYLEELEKIKLKYELFTSGASLDQLLENRKQLFEKIGLYGNKTNVAANKEKDVAMNDLRQAADTERQLSSQDLNVEMIHSLVDKKTKQLETLYSLMR